MYRISRLLTPDEACRYTHPGMKARRAVLAAGSVWELARFFLVLFLFAAVLRASAGAGAWVFPWLLVAGSGNLVIAAGSALLALFPDRYARLIGLLRLGKLLGVFALALLAISGALRAAAGFQLGGGRRALGAGSLLIGIFVLDVLFLAVLLGWHAEEPKPPSAPPEDRLPEYHETEVSDFH
jgi:hypothetical protein